MSYMNLQDFLGLNQSEAERMARQAQGISTEASNASLNDYNIQYQGAEKQLRQTAEDQMKALAANDYKDIPGPEQALQDAGIGKNFALDSEPVNANLKAGRETDINRTFAQDASKADQSLADMGVKVPGVESNAPVTRDGRAELLGRRGNASKFGGTNALKTLLGIETPKEMPADNSGMALGRATSEKIGGLGKSSALPVKGVPQNAMTTALKGAGIGMSEGEKSRAKELQKYIGLGKEPTQQEDILKYAEKEPGPDATPYEKERYKLAKQMVEANAAFDSIGKIIGELPNEQRYIDSINGLAGRGGEGSELANRAKWMSSTKMGNANILDSFLVGTKAKVDADKELKAWEDRKKATEAALNRYRNAYKNTYNAYGQKISDAASVRNSLAIAADAEKKKKEIEAAGGQLGLNNTANPNPVNMSSAGGMMVRGASPGVGSLTNQQQAPVVANNSLAAKGASAAGLSAPLTTASAKAVTNPSVPLSRQSVVQESMAPQKPVKKKLGKPTWNYTTGRFE